MTNLIMFVLATIGATEILAGSTLFAPVREWAKARLPERLAYGIECRQCLGAWVGGCVGVAVLGSWEMFPVWMAMGSAVAAGHHRLWGLADDLVLVLASK